ncbi:MAG: CDP-diacylglycerol--serine O-phosphatidyltransferase [Colwellia sp.]|nr:CDP-diacylglycerol--serine O-phosphatidyltransferase [Colwellia sp.]
MSAITVSKNDIAVFLTPKSYRQQLLQLIADAQSRIFITALYLQDDEAGREILHALYRAKTERPQLDIKIFVDYHRAQRGLIGEKDNLGNRSLYLSLAEQYQQEIEIYGVAVKGKEFLGVLHLKGMIFDDVLFYTGASINDVYLQTDTRYRLDRYYQISSTILTNSFCDYLQTLFVDSALCPRLNQASLPNKLQQKRNIARLKALLKKSSYCISKASEPADITIQPLVGYGARRNMLNNAIRKLVQRSQNQIFIFTPYFNIPKALARDIVKAMKRGVKITLVIGDKAANDFYIANDADFSPIGIVPYLYEMLLTRFVKRWQKFVDSDLLDIRLWQDEDNSFHLKGVVVDERYHLLTGSNLNPRAWSLDLENGLLVDDPQGHLLAGLEQEKEIILKNTRKVSHYGQLSNLKTYPEKPRKLLKKIQITQIDKVLKRFL